MATRKKAKKKKQSQTNYSANGLRPQIIMAGIILTILSLAALYLARGPVVVEPPRIMLSDELAVEIESVLLRSGFTLEQIDIQRDPEIVHYNVSGVMPTPTVLDRLQTRLQNRFPEILDDRNTDTGELLIYRNGSLVAVMQFEVGEMVVPPPPVGTTKPQLAIIMDDLGRSLGVAQQLIDLNLSVTLSILPGEPLATEVALLASRSGQEVMIHVPMEPQNYPETNPGKDALLLGQSDKEMRRRIATMIKAIPYASGANNHMGSRFTEYSEGMRTVLSIMRENGLFFVDSRTTAQSIVKREAERVGVPTTVRDVFLDNVAEVDAISVEISRLIKRAKQNGSAVGICHPYPETITALRLAKEQLQDSAIELVFASRLVSL